MSHASRVKPPAPSPWFRDFAIPPRRRVVDTELPQTRFATNHRAVIRQHKLEPSTCIIYDASGQPREAMDKLTRTRTALR